MKHIDLISVVFLLQATIDRFFIKKTKNTSEQNVEDSRSPTNTTESCIDSEIPAPSTSDVRRIDSATPSTSSQVNESCNVDPNNSSDISLFIGKKTTDEEKYKLIKNRWMPTDDFKFPSSGKRNLKFQRNWLIEFPWLTYSIKSDSAFCQFCALFCCEDVGKGCHTKPKALVFQPFNNWKDAKEQFRYHQSLDYHKKCTVFALNFLDVHDKKITSIDLQLDNAKKREIEMNRKILSSIIDTLIFIGRQEIACRGHRDTGSINSEVPDINDGNFRALLRFRISSGDSSLQKHLESTGTRYTSPLIQNELFEKFVEKSFSIK